MLKSPIKRGDPADTIYRLFLAPLIIYKPQHQSLAQWNDFLFNAEYRVIKPYVSYDNFEMPGLLKINQGNKALGLGNRKIKHGSRLCIRKDIRDDFYDIEVIRTGEVFELSDHEFKRIRHALVPAGFKKRKA